MAGFVSTLSKDSFRVRLRRSIILTFGGPGGSALLKRFLRDETAASAAEYALLLTVVGGAIVLGGLSLSRSIGSSMSDTAAVIDRPATAAAADGNGTSSGGGQTDGGTSGGNTGGGPPNGTPAGGPPAGGTPGNGPPANPGCGKGHNPKC